MYDKSTLTVQQLTQAVTDSVVGYKDSAKAAAETVRDQSLLVAAREGDRATPHASGQ